MWIGPIAYLGTQEVLIIGGIILLIFGGAKIPQLARGMGEGIRELKRSLEGGERETAANAPTADAAPTSKAGSEETATIAT
jgi:sec-independent protein translocase protein TatA